MTDECLRLDGGIQKGGTFALGIGYMERTIFSGLLQLPAPLLLDEMTLATTEKYNNIASALLTSSSADRHFLEVIPVL